MTATLHEEERKLTQLWFFHPSVDSHKAQALLLQNHVSVGTFLLRFRANKKGYAVSVKAGDTDVKHFEIVWTGSHFEFGHGRYDTVQELKYHFDNKPLIGGESGPSTLLRDPYPNTVEEPTLYQPVMVQAEAGRISDGNSLPQEYSINNKAGYLTKIGAVFKTWKTRWFVLQNNELKYFKDPSYKTPIRVLDLNECESCQVSHDYQDKKFVFMLKFNWRIFYMYASSEQEMNEWVEVINWRLNQNPNKHR